VGEPITYTVRPHHRPRDFLALLSARQLAVARGSRILVRGLDLALDAGEILHLRGANGAGKTSLLEVLCGLRAPADGQFEAPEPEALHWVGHRNALNLALSPLENLAFWCGLNEVDAAGIVPALERLAMGKWRHRPCRMLSAGQKRRSALARLLLARRAFWFLDEPLDGLDAEGLAVFAAMLREHAAGGGAAVVTSHQALPAGLDRVREFSL
jgi:heme exporter protein A